VGLDPSSSSKRLRKSVVSDDEDFENDNKGLEIHGNDGVEA
jgi:hypothetical protein